MLWWSSHQDEQVTKNMGLPFAYLLKLRTTLLRDLGGAMSPFNAWMFIQGLETPLRIENMQKMLKQLLKLSQLIKNSIGNTGTI